VSYYVHSHRGVIVPIHVPSDIDFLVYASHTNVFKLFEGLRLVLAWACRHTSYAQARNPSDAP